MIRQLMWVYSICYTLLLILYLPVLLYRTVLQGKSARSAWKRFASPPPTETGVTHGRSLWIHAVSVGEVKSVKPLVDALTPHFERLFVSTTTETGQQLALSLFGDRAVLFYIPVDWKWICRRYLKAIRPSAMLVVETEIWPGLISAAASLEIPLLLVNGRISDGSYRRYQHIRFFLKPLLQYFSRLCMQSRRDKQRIIDLGAEPARVNHMGNFKYDYQLHPSPEAESSMQLIRAATKSHPGDLLWICGSTREGEEEILLDIFSRLGAEFLSLRLLVAPRHPHRAPEISRLLESRQLSYLRRSEMNATNQAARVVLLDTIGELSHLYELADVVFVGGSLVATGGHNIIEAAHFGKPILFGPHMENFRDISTAFLQSYAALQVDSGAELESKVGDLLRDPAARRWLGRNARKVIRDNQGAIQRTTEVVETIATDARR